MTDHDTVDDLLDPEGWAEVERKIKRGRRKALEDGVLFSGLHDLLAFRCLLQADGPSLSEYIGRLPLEERSRLGERVADELVFLSEVLDLCTAAPAPRRL
jgi:hypothetical protein